MKKFIIDWIVGPLAGLVVIELFKSYRNKRKQKNSFDSHWNSVENANLGESYRIFN